MYVVGFNGPPRSGKDTAARMLREVVESRHDIPVMEASLSMPLRRIAYAMCGWSGEFDGPDYEAFKERFFPQFGKDGRHVMIDVSESFLKQVYGQAIMAEMLIFDIGNFDGLLLIRDYGFQCEAAPLQATFGTRNVYCVQVQRPGTSFDNDSREWVNHHDTGMQTTLQNFGDLSTLETNTRRIYSRMLNQLGWVL